MANNTILDANEVRALNAPNTEDDSRYQASTDAQIFRHRKVDNRVRISLPRASKNLFYQRHNTATQLLNPLDATDGIVFPFTPQIVINNSANYAAISPSQTNYAYQVYQNSYVGTINLFGQFTAQTPAEARYVLAVITFMRLATKSFRNDDPNAGNPPVILRLTGHGNNLLPNVPVVITSFDLTLPREVDYIAVSNHMLTVDDIPTMTDISITMTPVYSREQLSNYSMSDISNGNIGGYL